MLVLESNIQRSLTQCHLKLGVVLKIIRYNQQITARNNLQDVFYCFFIFKNKRLRIPPLFQGGIPRGYSKILETSLKYLIEVIQCDFSGFR